MGPDTPVEDQILQLHATMVETITATEHRRQNYSAIAIGIISIGSAIIGSGVNIDTVAVVIPIFIASLLWMFASIFFEKLAKVKWSVVKDLEKKLKYKPFTDEWDKFQNQRSWYVFGPAKLEKIMPLFITIASASYLIFRAVDYLCFCAR